jgi:hypothetical protein
MRSSSIESHEGSAFVHDTWSAPAIFMISSIFGALTVGAAGAGSGAGSPAAAVSVGAGAGVPLDVPVHSCST